jgi:hypothetical protein
MWHLDAFLLYPVHATFYVLQAMQGFGELKSYWQQWRVGLAATYRRAEEAVAAGEGGGLGSAGCEAAQQLQLHLLEMTKASVAHLPRHVRLPPSIPPASSDVARASINC